MKNLKSLPLVLIVFLSISCKLTKIQKKGTVLPGNFDYETEFTTVKTLLLIPSKINGVSKNLLFDTGAQLSLIQRDSLIGESITIKGASERSIQGGSELIKSFKIGEVEFINTFSTNTDMVGIKEKIPNFGGLIGQTIINKANWLIDYSNKKLRISNKNLADETFKTIKIKRKNGSPYTYISINGIKHKVVIDLGSSSEFSIPKESELAQQLLQQYKFKDNKRERYTIGGNQIVQEKVGVVPLVKLGDIEFKNVNAKINLQSQLRIGISFFKDYIIYIDNLENNYKIKK